MTSVGNVELSVSLSLAKLLRDAQLTNRQLKQQLQDVNVGVSAPGLGQVDDDLRKAASAARELEDAGKGASNVLTGIGQGIGAGLSNAAIGIIQGAAGAITEFGRATLDAGTQAEQAAVTFETLLGSAEAGQKAIADLKEFAATTPFEFPQVRQAGQSLLAFGVTVNDLEPTLRRVGDVASGVSADFNELAQIYGKAKVQGRLFAEDVNQLTGRGIPVIQEFAKQFGVTDNEVKGLVESGKIGFPQLEQAFISLTSEGGKFFNLMDKQSKTVGGQISNLADRFTAVQESAFKAFSPVITAGIEGFSEALTEAGKEIDNLDELQKAGERLQETLGDSGIADALGSALGELVNGAIATATNALNALAATVKENPKLFTGFINTLASLGGVIGAIVNTVGDFLGFLLKLNDNVAATSVAFDILTNSFQIIERIINLVGQGYQNLAQLFGGALPNPFVGVLNTVNNVLKKVKELLGITDQAKTGLSDFTDRITPQEQASQQAAKPVANTASKDAESETDKIKAELEKQLNAFENGYKQRQTVIANAVATGNTTEEQARQQSLTSEKNYLNQRLAANQQALAKLEKLKGATTDPKEQKKIGEEITRLESQIASDRLNIAKSAADARVRADEEAEKRRKKALQDSLKAVEEANKRAERAIANSQSQRITAVKQNQLNGAIGEQEAARQIAAIQQQATSEAIAQKQREIAEVAKLRQEGVLSEEDALTKTSALQGEITNLNLQRIDQELAARKAAAAQQIQLAEQQLQVQQQVAQARLDAGSQGIQAELDLLSAATGLQEAQKNLSVERLNTQLKIAEAAGDEATAARLKLQITQTEQGFEDKVYQVKLKQLELTKQQKNLELERQRLTAQNAIEEAKLSILKAEQSGATAEEISGLQRILAVRQQQLGLVDRQQSTLDQLTDLERKTLETQQQITAEKRRQAALDGQAIQDASTKNQLEQQRPGFTVSGADIQQSRNAGQALQSTSGALNALTGPNPNRFVADLASPVVRQLAALANTGLSGRIQASDLAQQVDRGLLTADDVGRKLDQLIAATNRSSGRPNLSISNVQDLSLAGRIYSDISRDQLRSGGL